MSLISNNWAQEFEADVRVISHFSVNTCAVGAFLMNISYMGFYREFCSGDKRSCLVELSIKIFL